jgi:hypothetical protein
MLYGNRRRFDRRVTSTAIPATTRKSSRWVAAFTASSSAAASVVAERIGVAARMSWRAKRGADELNRDARGGFNRPDSRRRFKSRMCSLSQRTYPTSQVRPISSYSQFADLASARQRCCNRLCERKTFVRQPDRAFAPRARETRRVAGLARSIGYVAGGRPAERLMRRLSLPGAP